MWTGSAVITAAVAALLLGLVGPASARPAALPASTTIHIGEQPTAIAIDGKLGLVWVADGGHVTEISAVTRKVVRTIPLAAHLSGITVDPGTSTVWVVNRHEGTVTELSENDGVIVGTIQLKRGITVISDGMYLLDPASNAVITIPAGGGSPPVTTHLPAGFAPTVNAPPAIATGQDGRPWVVSNQFVSDGFRTASLVSFPDSLSGVAANLALPVTPASSGVAVVGSVDPDDDHSGALYLLAEDLSVLKTIALPHRPSAIDVDPAFADAWVTSNIADQVMLVNLATGSVSRSLPVGDNPTALAVDHVTRTVWVVNQFGGSVTVYHYAQPRFTTRSLVHAQAGRELKFTALAAGFPVPAMRITGKLPAGVRSHRGSGGVTIAGKPHRSAAHRTYRLTLTADNGVGVPVIQHLVIKVS